MKIKKLIKKCRGDFTSKQKLIFVLKRLNLILKSLKTRLKRS